MADGEISADMSLPEKKSGYTFGHNETLLLISLYQKYEVFFSDVSYKKKAIWQMIADDMKKNGYSPSAINCENRWKCLTSSFRKCEDNNNKSGRGRKECKFYKELAEVYGYRPNVRPFVTFSSAVGKTARAVGKETLESESSLEPEVSVYYADNSGSSTDVTTVKAETVLNVNRKEKPARKRKSTQESSKVIEWLEVYNQERKVEEEKRRKTQEKHHHDNLSVLSNLVDVLKAWKK